MKAVKRRFRAPEIYRVSVESETSPTLVKEVVKGGHTRGAARRRIVKVLEEMGLADLISKKHGHEPASSAGNG
jgi:hypothetical protein